MSAGVVGVVLAAGLSRRMGEPKQLLNVVGQPLVRYAARAMLDAEPVGGVLVVTPPGELGSRVRAALDGLPLSFTECLQPELGLSYSFRAAIEALPPGTPAASFALGDMPLVTAAMHRAVLDAWAASGENSSGAPLVLARFGEVRAPPHLFRADLFGGFGQEGDHGPRDLIRDYAARAVWVDLPPAALQDLDTPGDLPRVEAALLAGAAGP